MKLIKTILTDVLGVFLIILSGLLGWIPGPGGIPLLIAGLSLLSINHEWARRLLKKVKENGLKFLELFFKEHRLLMVIYDVASIALVVVGITLLGQATRRLWQTVLVAMILIGIGVFLGNRKRSQRIVRFFKKSNKQ